MTEETLVLGKSDFSVVRKPAEGGALSDDVWLVFQHQGVKGEMKVSINLSSLVRRLHHHKVRGLTPEEELAVLLAAAPKQVRVYRRKAVFSLCEMAAEAWFDTIGPYSAASQLEAQTA